MLASSVSSVKRYLSLLPDAVKTRIHVLILFAATIGFVTQVMQVSLQYFSYKTLVQVHIKLPSNVIHRSVALCIGAEELMDLKKFGGKGAVYDDGRMTIRQIFERTPDTDIIARCKMRRDDYRMIVASGKECHQYLNVTKFFTQFFMCYRFKPLINTTFSFSGVTQSWNIYAVTTVHLKPVMNGAHYVSPIIFDGDYPYVSRGFAPYAYLYDSENRTIRQYNFLDITPSNFMFERLPPPYDTMCDTRDNDGVFDCKLRCQLEEYRIGEKVPVTEIFAYPMDYQRITPKDLKDTQVFERMARVTDKCNRECEFHSCHYAYTKTTIKARFVRNNDMAYYARTPNDPDIISSNVSAYSFVDFFSFLCGCFGIWFGVSFLSLDPFAGQQSDHRPNSAVKPLVVQVINPSDRVARILRGSNR